MSHKSFDEFVETVAALRDPDGGCPWDLEQTHESVSQNIIEEAYETVEAIEDADIDHLREELGDLLLQVVLQSQIAADANEFDIDDVCNDINTKIVRRHPHVFGDAKASTAAETIRLWDKIKLDEKKSAEEVPTDEVPELLAGIPKALPALMQAQKISRKAAAVGFEWESVDDVWDKVEEEMQELKDAYASANPDGKGAVSKDDPYYSDIEMEFGDVLFTLVNVARRMGINSEEALRKVCAKFRSRWRSMEIEADDNDIDIRSSDIETLDALWQNAKQAESRASDNER